MEESAFFITATELELLLFKLLNEILVLLLLLLLLVIGVGGCVFKTFGELSPLTDLKYGEIGIKGIGEIDGCGGKT